MGQVNGHVQKKSTQHGRLFGNRVGSKANTFLISQLNGDNGFGLHGINLGRLVAFVAFIADAVADKGELEEVELFLAYSKIATGQAGKVEDIPAGQQHPRIDDAIVFLTADQRADHALQAIDDPFPIAKSQPNEQTKKDGYHQAMLSLSTFDGKVYGLPFAVSLPVGYYNMDLVKKAGVKKLPATWDEVVDMCGKLKAAGVQNPMFWGWNITGNWFMQALMWSQDTPIVKGNEVNFNGPAGLKSLETMKKIFRGCEMKNLTYKEALASFSAGQIAMMFWSTSAVGSVERSKGDFELKTNEFPGIDGAPKGLPAGGNAAMLVSQSKDPARLEAAWKFLKFITSGVGAAAVAETTGYMPPNKAANEIILADFYKNNPAKATAVRQLPLLRDWIAYPGDKGLAVTKVIYDAIEGIVIGDNDDMKELQEELSEEVQSMLPKGSS